MWWVRSGIASDGERGYCESVAKVRWGCDEQGGPKFTRREGARHRGACVRRGAAQLCRHQRADHSDRAAVAGRRRAGLDRRDDAVLRDKIGRAHVRTPVTNAHLVCRLLLEKKKQKYHMNTIANNRNEHPS